ncbi:MAG: tetratricopeptide repeat protein, partial [Opitutaceae bacterium]|nr:tetratricopeptide repeat protein [Opitutaceae bacterium]
LLPAPPPKTRPAVPEESPPPAYAEPADRLLAETGADRLAYRGWPLRIRHVPLRENAAPVLSPLEVRASTGEVLLRIDASQPAEWWLPPEASARLPVGRVVLSAAGTRTELAVADAPAAPSALQEAELRLARIAHAVAGKDTAAAQREAEAWLASADPRDPRPHVALGDVYVASGDDDRAYTAYRAALDRGPQGHPDLVIARKLRAVLSRRLATLPVHAEGSAPAATPATADAPHPLARPVAPAPAPDTAKTPPPAAPVATAGLRWATGARASSEYETKRWGAVQAVGAPDVTQYGDSPASWTPRAESAGEEWLELAYEPAIEGATGVRVVQNFNPGALLRIELIAPDGTAATVWTGPDTTAYPKNQIGIFEARFSPPEKPVAKVKLTFDTKRVPGWKEIDAVGLSVPAHKN